MSGAAFDMYGRIKEGVHIAGYSFERACGHLEWLLDEDRWKLGGRFDDVNTFLDSIKLDQFRIVTEQRQRIARRIKELQPQATTRTIAGVLGSSKSAIIRDVDPNGSTKKPKPAENGHSEKHSDPNGSDLTGSQVAELAQKKAATGSRRAERLKRIEEIARCEVPLPTGRRYPIIYADPPWRYENPPMGGSNRSIENHYPTMTLDDICALPVREIAADDSLLYLWATAPKLPECLKVVEAWGFEYRTHLVWVKDKIGMGYHARSQHELLLIAKRGQMPPPQAGEQPSSIIEAPRGQHSAKPAIFAELIESLYPGIGRIELFARSPRDGWAVWGNQAEARDAA